MPIDEVLLRDSCGKSSAKLKKYFYYNEYSKDNFNYISDYNELDLLNPLLEGKIPFIDLAFMVFPYILIFLLAIVCIGIWISICCCSCRPKCLLKRNNKNPNRKRFICFMVFLGFSFSIIILGITVMIYINIAEKNFNGSICSLFMFQYEIINGQGLLARKHIYKPYWYGSTQIGINIDKINVLLNTLQSNCRSNKADLRTATQKIVQAYKNLYSGLELIYLKNKEESIKVSDVDGSSNKINIIPLYILNLGPKENKSTLIGEIYDEYINNFHYMLSDIMAPITITCEAIGTDQPSGRLLTGEDESPLSNGLGEFNTIIQELNNTLDSISSMVTEYIANYKNYIINFGFKVNFSLFAIIVGSIIIETIFYIIYYFHPFSLIKCNIYFFIQIINLVLILCIIYNGIFGLFSFLIGNITDIIDAALSKENLSSAEPKLIEDPGQIKKLEKCLRGDGNLFQEFMNDDDNMKLIIENLTSLFTLYTPVKKIKEKIKLQESNEYNTFMKLDEIINNLTSMEHDFIPTTSNESAGNYDIQFLFDSLTSYTNKKDVKNFQDGCSNPTYDIWTTVLNECPRQNPGIINDKCKLLKNYLPNSDNNAGNTGCNTNAPPGGGDVECEAKKISNNYNLGSGCSVLNIKTEIENYSKTLLQYYFHNGNLIKQIVGETGDTFPNPIDDTSLIKLYMIKKDFEENFIKEIKDAIDIIDEKITSNVYEVFNEFLNVTTKDTYTLKNSEDFNLFSWMNCSVIGQDYNATLSTLKSNLTKELKIITYVSLFFEFLSIANLYIMVGLSKNLRDKKYEKDEENNVSIEEIDIYEKKEIKDNDEIYSIKNKNKIDSSEKLEKNLITENNGMKTEENDKDNNPTAVSINGSDRKTLSENGEKVNEILNIKRKNNKDIESKNSRKTNDDKKK